MTRQAIDILSSWRPNRVAPPPADLVARYERLIRFLDGLPSDARAGRILRMAGAKHEVETIRCVRCLSAVGEDNVLGGVAHAIDVYLTAAKAIAAVGC